MSLAVVNTRAKLGINAPLVSVEVHLSNGLPSFHMVGLPETAVKESKDRVRSAILNSLFDFPARRITVNLAPAELPKEGSRFDLAIAVAILAASGQIPLDQLDQYEFIGELALSGDTRGVDAVLPAALGCLRQGKQLIISHHNAEEASLVEGLEILPCTHLLEISAHLLQQTQLTLWDASKNSQLAPQTPLHDRSSDNQSQLNQVIGQHHAKRAGLLCSLGIALGLSVHIVYSSLGLAAVIANSSSALWGIKLLGGGYLIYLGINGLRARARKVDSIAIETAPEQSGLKTVGLGFLCNALNPKAPIYFVSLFTIVLSQDTPAQHLLIYGLWMMVLQLAWFAFLTMLLSRPAVTGKFHSMGHWIDRIAGGAMLLLGFKVLATRTS